MLSRILLKKIMFHRQKEKFKTVQVIFNNVKDWNGARQKRRKHDDD